MGKGCVVTIGSSDMGKFNDEKSLDGARAPSKPLVILNDACPAEVTKGAQR